MGQVFTWDAVKNGRIPTGTDFKRVAEFVRAGLSAAPSIRAALLFGSTLRGDHDRAGRSDLDVLVIDDATKGRSADEVTNALIRRAAASHVPINLTCCSDELARTSLHNLGTAFVRHLQTAVEAGGMIKGALAEHLAPTLPVQSEIREWVRNKAFKLEVAFKTMESCREDRQMAMLQKALEAPTHLARKMLIYFDQLEGDSKRDVRTAYQKAMPTDLAEAYEKLLELDGWYSEQVLVQRTGPKVLEYQRCIGNLKYRAREVLPFLYANVRMLDQTARL